MTGRSIAQPSWSGNAPRLAYHSDRLSTATRAGKLLVRWSGNQGQTQNIAGRCLDGNNDAQVTALSSIAGATADESRSADDERSEAERRRVSR